jgi:hypothetical protein
MAPLRPPIGRSLLLALLVGLFLSVVGALGTDAAPLVPRTGYWLVIMLTGAVLGSSATFTVQIWGRLRHRRLLEGAIIALLITIPLSLVVTGAGMVVFEEPVPEPSRFGGLFGVVLMVSSAMTALGYATSTSPIPEGDTPGTMALQPLPRPMPAEPEPDMRATGLQADADTQPPLMDRLPTRLRAAKLIALEAEDHYLRVHTDAGSDLILLRLSDAIAETGVLAGAQCHRSWWVARSAVAGASRRGAGAILTLTNGLEVPVSRSHLPSLRADGWLRPERPRQDRHPQK